jgi:RNA polymerase sigma-70 factor (ECF subfamily)
MVTVPSLPRNCGRGAPVIDTRTADHQDDDSLLIAIAGGDEQAYSTLVQRQGDRLYGYLMRLTRSPADAEDLLQETFLRVWRSADSYRPGNVAAATWIHRIAHNLYIDSFRAKRRRAGISVELDDSVPLEHHTGIELESGLVSAQLLEQVEDAISRLPENQRAALLLCQTQGFSNPDAANILGISVRAVESLLARARRTLRQAIPKGDNDEL